MSHNIDNIEAPYSEILDKQPIVVALKSTRFWVICLMGFCFACKSKINNLTYCI